MKYAATDGKKTSRLLFAVSTLAVLGLIGELIIVFLSLHPVRFSLLGFLILIWSIYMSTFR
jgi:hypothetical protein